MPEPEQTPTPRSKRPSRARAPALVALALLSLALLGASAGCGTPIGVRRVGAQRAYRELTSNALTRGEMSDFSARVLARYALVETFANNPEKALAELFRRAWTEDSRRRDLLFALAELSFLFAEERGHRQYYAATTVFSYLTLLGKDASESHDAYDPRHRLACELYNRSLAEFLTSPQGEFLVEDRTQSFVFGRIDITASRPGFPWGPEEFDHFVPCSRYSVRGLREVHRNWGLGAPLIARRTEASGERSPGERMARARTTAATAFLRLSEGSDGFENGHVVGSLELYAPSRSLEIEVNGNVVPLQADLTTPLAFGLQSSRLWELEFGAFFGADDAVVEPGLYALEPYTPGKIPVVFVHGTASSPARWAETFNGLQVYEEIRQNFQFWFFIYTTGNPIPYSAALLREALDDAHEELDAEREDRALEQMVVVGHSQGGTLTRLLTFDSGDLLWNRISRKPIDELDLAPISEDILRRSLFFERLPFVTRVVFIATPHGGSFRAGNWLGRVASSFITLPKDFAQLGRDLVRGNLAGDFREIRADLPTSIVNMDPASPFVQVIQGTEIAPEVRRHSIIAVKGSGPAEEGNDGVVEYKSAHFPDADSELVVRSGHSCQGHPLAILEIRRILAEHLAATRAAR